MKRATIALCCGLLVLLAGFGGTDRSSRADTISLQFELDTWTHKGGMEPQARSFSLTCNPTGGTLPLAERICRDVELHPKVMLDPPPRICNTGAKRPPTLAVMATANGRTTRFDTWKNCGVTIEIYSSAIEENLAEVERLEPQLRCFEGAMVRAHFMSVHACRRGLWTPRWRSLIRLAESTPSLAAVRPARLFPGNVGVRECTIPTGGTSRERLPGVCAISAKGAWPSPILGFRETWTGPGGRTRRHTWRIVFDNGRVISVSESGQLPPQAWTQQ